MTQAPKVAEVPGKGSKLLLFVVNCPEFFRSHRLPIALAAKAAGYEVHIATANGEAVETIEKAGLRFHPINFARSGQNPLVEIKIFIQLLSLLRRLKPDLVHLVTIKPVLYGGIAARIAGVPRVVAAVSGLGTVFNAGSLIGRLRRWAVIRLYSAAFRQQKLTVIFQNPEDRRLLLKTRALDELSTRMIRGSGVNLDEYPYYPEPKGDPVVTMAARLLRDKGVFEYVGAARILRDRGLKVDMRLIGSTDPHNPTSVSEADLDRWKKEGAVTLLGYRSDIAQQYAVANIVCLPSYREGLPKSLVEAAACGRAVVTTDRPGCRDAIEPGETGVLVPVRDEIALANAIQKLIEAPQTRHRMGAAGRALAEAAFDINKIIDQHLQIYRDSLDGQHAGVREL